MPITSVQSPDGRIIKVEHPEGASQSEIMAYAQKNYKPAPQQEAFDPAAATMEGMSGFDRFAAGAGKGMTDLAYGAGQLVGLVDQEDIQRKQRLDAPLSNSGGLATAGEVTGKIAAALPAMLIPGANTLAGASLLGAGTGLMEPVADGNVLTGKAANAALGAGGGAAGYGAGKYLTGKIGGALASREAARAAQKTSNSVKDATVQNARNLGYTVNPTQANPSFKNQLLEGLSGKIKTQQLAAERNQGVTNAIAKKTLGLADDAQLTPDTIEGVRRSAGKVYETVKNTQGKITADQDYYASLSSLLDENRALSQDFPELADKGIDDLVATLSKPEFSPASAIEAIKRLRSNAKTMFKSDDPAKVAVARASKQASDAIEGLVERNLSASGNTELFGQFKAARELIAKTYTIESALNQGSGNVVGGKLAGQLAKGKPLSGDLKQAAQFSAAFPRATQEITSSMPMISPLDVYATGATAVASGNPLVMGAIGARPAARNMLLSNFYQNRNLTPSYAKPAYESLLGGAAPRLSQAGTLLGSRAAVQ